MHKKPSKRARSVLRGSVAEFRRRRLFEVKDFTVGGTGGAASGEDDVVATLRSGEAAGLSAGNNRRIPDRGRSRRTGQAQDDIIVRPGGFSPGDKRSGRARNGGRKLLRAAAEDRSQGLFRIDGTGKIAVDLRPPD